LKKNKKRDKNKTIEPKNLVAKHAHYFNKAFIFKDKSKYQRQTKHKNFDSFFMQFIDCIKNESKFSAILVTHQR